MRFRRAVKRGSLGAYIAVLGLVFDFLFHSFFGGGMTDMLGYDQFWLPPNPTYPWGLTISMLAHSSIFAGLMLLIYQSVWGQRSPAPRAGTDSVEEGRPSS